MTDNNVVMCINKKECDELKLVKLKLKNFRGYNEAEVNFQKDINCLIGRNDVGKSTILDALDIFFNDAKIEPSDCNRNAESKTIEISALFEVSGGNQIILDTTNPTSLQEEYLLNEDGLLEIKKEFLATGKTITASNIKVYIVSYHPETSEKPLITYKVNELKALLKEKKDEIENYEGINKLKKAELRKALFINSLNMNSEFKETPIKVSDIQEGGLNTWIKIKEHLPVFQVFQSDRNNSDEDKEIQDPIKAITKEVIGELEHQLNDIRNQVVNKVEAIGKQTLEKLKELDPQIANELKTIPELKNWDSVFKFKLDTDNEIPLNKRGSGVRRLILLSYFRAQAEKASFLDKGIIYAIEEPETSQHPNYQKMIVKSLLELSQKDNSQVLITTHTPEIAQMVAKESLILISKNQETGLPEIISDESARISEIIDTLGILPTIHAGMVICVEGSNDIDFLKNINSIFKDIIDFNECNISLYELGGSKLIDFINQNHFKESNIKEFHIYDGDIEKYKELVMSLNDDRRFGVTTKYREMENYIPIHIIEDYFDCDLQKFKEEWDTFNVPKYLADTQWLNRIPDYKKREKAIKGALNSRLAGRITKEALVQHNVYEEVEGWFKKIKEIYDTTVKKVEV